MPALETLDLSGRPVQGRDGLAEKCPNLRELDIRQTKVQSLEGLPPSVTVLYVGDKDSVDPEDW